MSARGPDRTAAALLCAGALVALLALLRPMGSSLPEGLYWARKATMAPADVVLAGDSRVYRALSPAAMRFELGRLRIVNFAWSSSGFSPAYLAAIDRQLDPRSARASVVLGITPWTLTPRSETETNFVEWQRKSRLGLEADLLLGRVAGRLESLIPFVPRLRGREYRQDFQDDGWVASRLEPPDPEFALESYGRAFVGNTVSRAMTDSVLKQVGLWRSRGVRVYAFRPPTTVAMVRLENDVSGFDQAGFVAAFTAAGGVWIDVPQARVYESYDGSHIVDRAATRFSHDLARTLRWLHEHPDVNRRPIDIGP